MSYSLYIMVCAPGCLSRSSSEQQPANSGLAPANSGPHHALLAGPAKQADRFRVTALTTGKLFTGQHPKIISHYVELTPRNSVLILMSGQAVDPGNEANANLAGQTGGNQNSPSSGVCKSFISA